MNHSHVINALLLLWVALMASSFVISDKLLPYASPVVATGFRFILTTLCLLPFIWQRGVLKLAADQLVKLSIASLFLVLFFIGLFESLKTTSPANTAVIYTLLPLLCVAASYFLLGAVASLRQLLGFTLGTIGACYTLIIAKGDTSILSSWNQGDNVFLLACLSLAIHVVLIKKFSKGIPAIISTFYIVFFGSMLLVPLMLLFGNLKEVAWYNTSFWFLVGYLTLFTTLATFFLQQHLLKYTSANKFLAITYLVPTLVVFSQPGSSIEMLVACLPALIIILIALYLITQES